MDLGLSGLLRKVSRFGGLANISLEVQQEFVSFL